jgi:tRNA G18 (ribose-2'-O)-methylase SpoU
MNIENKERWTRWQRNVIDEYKPLSVEEIREDLRSKAHPFSTLMEHWKGDFNVATMIRNANAFNCSEVFYLGRKHIDKRGTVGTHHYVELQHLDNYNDLLSLKERYTFVALDNNVDNCVSMNSFEWPPNSLMIFGEEGEGITPRLLEMCDYIVCIPQFGSVRSLNVGTSSGIAMYDYTTKYLNSP